MTNIIGKQRVAFVLGTLLACLTGCTISSNTSVDKQNDQPPSKTPVDQTRDKPTSNIPSIEEQLEKHLENELKDVYPIMELAILHFATTGKLATREDILALVKSEERDIDLAAFSELTCSIENEKFTMHFARANSKSKGKVSIPHKDLLLAAEALREKKRECKN